MEYINITKILKDKYNLDLNSMTREEVKEFIKELRKNGDKPFITIKK